MKSKNRDVSSIIKGEGTVIRNTGSSYAVRLDSGEETTCRVKGNFRIKGTDHKPRCRRGSRHSSGFGGGCRLYNSYFSTSQLYHKTCVESFKGIPYSCR